MEQAPRVSLGMPVYNGEEYLEESVGDLLAQTFEDFELVISDNASTDRTEEICRALAARDPRVRYFRETENRGACWNHNRVVQLARGEFFKFAAHDDRHAPTYLERCVEILDAHPDVVWCHSVSTHIDPSGHRLDGPNAGDVGFAAASVHPSWRHATRESTRAQERFRAVLLGPGGNKDVFGLIRTEAVRRAAPMIPHYGMDKVLVAELSLLGRYREVPEVLFFGRIHPRGSGALATADQQRRFIAPRDSRRFAFTRLHLLFGHIRSVRRARLSFGERLACYGVLIQYLFQFKKWFPVLGKVLTRSGTGGAYVEPLERVKRRNESSSSRAP
jgi:glycosyltransferase involved in cell wall biosynthesis